MARDAKRRKQDAEVQLLEAEVEAQRTKNAARRFDITERKWALCWRSIFLAITVVLIGLTVYSYLSGSHRTLPLVTGPSGLGTAAASFLMGRSQQDRPPR